MHPIVKYWPYAMLAARWKYDYDLHNDIPNDYVETIIKRWHPDCNFHKYRPLGIAYSYSVELDDVVILSHLGTISDADMRKNFSGAIAGFFKNTFLPKKSHCHSDYWMQGCETFDVMKRAYLCKKPIVQVAHSKGCGRSVVFARRAVESGLPKPLTIQYNPPPAYTSKGVKIYDKLGLQEATYRVYGKDDIVSKASMFGYYKHVGIPVQLPDVVGQVADIPFVGEHAYSTDTESLKQWCEEREDDEGIMYLESKEFVEVC